MGGFRVWGGLAFRVWCSTEVQAGQSRKATVRKAIGSVNAVSLVDEQPTQHPEEEAAETQGAARVSSAPRTAC